MATFDRQFLEQVAGEYGLTPKQKEVFVELFSRSNEYSEGKLDEAAETLHISASAFRSRMTGVYERFRCGGDGPGKFNQLWHYLNQQKQARTVEEKQPDSQTESIDALVQSVRQKIHSSVQKRCGTMRVLDMEQPISLDSIYTTVNILEKVQRNQRCSIEELLKGCKPEDFDRFLLGQVRQKRVPGLEAVERHDKLMILGKPGAGKTTFLKWLAIQCNAGQLRSEQVPIFITLKEFAETSGQPTLIEYINTQLKNWGVQETDAAGQTLSNGKALVLLDGLDEVREVDHNRVLQTICSTTERFDSCQFVITCRIAAREYTFQQFTEVEIADFDNQQITDFAQKWFQAKEDPVKAEEFPQELEAHPGLKELATNPLLLTLLCLVFEERAGFPANRAELYKEGVDVLLKKWDGKRNIKRDEVYKQLSLNRKEDLLSQIALTTFERSEYFFKQRTVEEQIKQYIRNLPGANTDPEALQLDSEAVLKSIEAQHGLLVERARSIYSFSHLTFQEYFTAYRIKEKASDETLAHLMSHLGEKRWREVFLLTVGMLPKADRCLLLMKEQIDHLLNQEQELQKFLIWVANKTASVQVPYKPAAVRAFYFAIARDLDIDIARDTDLARAIDLVRARALYPKLARDLTLARAIARERDLTRTRDLARDRALTLVLTRDCARDHDLAIQLANQPELKELLKNLKAPIPHSQDIGKLKQWWQTQRGIWVKQLRAAMKTYRNIGHDWQFTEVQHQKLQEYYDANKLLVDCLNSDCYVSREVREEIEATLLLPIAAIDRYKSTNPRSQ